MQSISLQELDELEARVLRALELISDLRGENAQLEEERQKFKQEKESVVQELIYKNKELEEIKTGS